MALPCMGQIRSRQFLGNLVAVYAQEKNFLVQSTLVQCIKLSKVCGIVEKTDMCFANVLVTFFKHYSS